MMSRREMDDVRVRLDDLAAHPRLAADSAEAVALALRLHTEMKASRTREAQLRATLCQLVAACRASVAAARGELVHIEHQLAAHGWMPGPDATPQQMLAAVSDLRDLLEIGTAA